MLAFSFHLFLSITIFLVSFYHFHSFVMIAIGQIMYNGTDKDLSKKKKKWDRYGVVEGKWCYTMSSRDKIMDDVIVMDVTGHK